MAFPTEAAEQLRRRVIAICQDHIRKVLDAARELPQMIDGYIRDDLKEVQEHHGRVVKLEEEATGLKRLLMRELTRAGAILLSREDFLRLIATSNEIIDLSGGVSYRLNEMASRSMKADKELLEDLLRLSEATLDSVVRLRETILSLDYGTGRTADSAGNVEGAEQIVDSLYRKVDLKIISSKLPTPVMLIMRDVARFFEEMADKAEDAADAANILSLSAL